MKNTTTNSIRARRLLVGLGALALSSLGTLSTASAVTPLLGAERTRTTQGTTSVQLANSNTAFCFLTRVRMSELDNGSSEFADCRIIHGSIAWSLEVTLGQSGTDASVTCTATCFNN